MAGFLIREDRDNCPPRSVAALPPPPPPPQSQPQPQSKLQPQPHQRIARQPLKARDTNKTFLTRNHQHQHQPLKVIKNETNNENQPHVNVKFEKHVQPPVAQFEAFSVYENVSDDKENVPKGVVKVQAKQRNKKEVPAGVLKLHSQRIVTPQKSTNNATISTPMSIASDTSLCLAPESETKAEDRKKASAKTARELFFHVTEYRDDIYNYMREIEVKYRARPDYMRKQTDITHSMRAILIDWLVEVCEEYRLETETLYLAVSYIDRFLSYMAVVRAKLQLVGTTAMFIASKYEEIYPPDLREFVYITDETYTKQQVLRMEHLILKVLSFDLSTPTPLAFISLFCISNGLSERTRYLAMYISELALLEAEPYLQYTSSIIAASALAIARHALLCCHCSGRPQSSSALDCLSPLAICTQAAWTPALQRISGYGLADLEKCMRELARTHAGAAGQPHQAIVEKYKSNKYEGVALIEAKSMYSMSAPNEKIKCTDLVVENLDMKSDKSDKKEVLST
ncbi:cyclin-A1-like [Arctopsyche grandis]|uniref:cyclin-A1-like n=1 Tax=Arctopsyche grandis TaxID=121162 RepID=UPI00406D9D5B